MTYKLRIALLAVAGLLALPVLASAFHWPNQGGDPGRSGFQPVDQAALPISSLWAASDSGEPRTSIVTSGGATPSERILAYGKQQVVAAGFPASNSNDRADVHIRQLDTGDERTSESTRDVDDGTDDPDAFGPEPGGVSFVDSSSAAAPGQLYVVHNDDNSAAQTANRCGQKSSTNDIAIARFDEATGAKKGDFAVGPVEAAADPLCPGGTQVSEGYTVESAPVITPPLDAEGTRWIYFVARPDSAAAGPSAARLFGVRVSKADSPDAVVHSDSPQVRTFTSGVNTKASPTLLYLNDPQSLTSAPRLYVAVAGQDIPADSATEPAADIRTYAVGDIADSTEDGPTGDAGGAGVAQTPSVPVTASGQIPGPGTSEPKAPAIYAAYNVSGSTTVRKFVQSGSSSVLDVTSSPESIAGAPAPGLALSVLAANGGEAPGRVIVTTGADLVLLNSSTLAKADEFDAGGVFSRNIAAASGNLIFVTNNSGDQAVLSLTDGEPVATSSFAPNPGNAGADFALGQPSYSDGFLQFLTDAGVFVYRTAQITEPPVPKLTITPNPVRQGGQVTLDGSGSSDPDGSVVRYELDLDGNGQYETDLGAEPKVTTTASAPPGTYKVFLRVTDDDGATATTSQDLVVSGNQAPAASFTFTPNPAKTRQKVTFDATASKDADGSIAKYEWDLDGNGTFERTTTEPTTSRRYRRAGLYNPKLRVTDNEGATGEASRQVVVTQAGRIKARRLTAKVRPRSDTTPPRRFTTKGRLVLPKGVSRKRACRGRVTVTVKAGKDTISRRTTKLRRTCRYRKSVTFDERDRFDGVNKLKFKARFQGNRTMLPRQAKTKRVRISAE